MNPETAVGLTPRRQAAKAQPKAELTTDCADYADSVHPCNPCNPRLIPLFCRAAPLVYFVSFVVPIPVEIGQFRSFTDASTRFRPEYL